MVLTDAAPINSHVTIKSGGYGNIVVAINPNVRERQCKDILTDLKVSSQSLFTLFTYE